MQAARVPAAQYLRMSTDEQEFSLANQAAHIARYAETRGFEVVRSYQDPGKSGVLLKHRKGLSDLLADVVGGNANYKAILVYDVSRWGRFQDADEAAHYEFLCKSAGVQVRYCAEPFENDGLLPHYLVKVLKRTMAAEYSRELGVKSFESQQKFVRLGFRMGSQPGYGFRRMAVSANGKAKGLLDTGQCKSLLTDRVTLVHGPQEEVQCVRRIYALCLNRGLGLTAIARFLNRLGRKRRGAPWTQYSIREVLTNPKYAGWYVWNRTSRKLHSAPRPLAPDRWLSKRNAFPPIVSQLTFDRVQSRLRRNREATWSDAELLRRLKLLLARRGYLGERLIAQTKGMPSVSTYYKRLGPFQRIYELIRYRPSERLFNRCYSRRNTVRLRDALIGKIKALFPDTAKVFRLPRKMRPILQFGDLAVSVILCPTSYRAKEKPFWCLNPVPAESGFITLLCTLNSANDGFHSFYLFPRIDKSKTCRLREECGWLSRGERLEDLTQLYDSSMHLSIQRRAES